VRARQGGVDPAFRARQIAERLPAAWETLAGGSRDPAAIRPAAHRLATGSRLTPARASAHRARAPFPGDKNCHADQLSRLASPTKPRTALTPLSNKFGTSSSSESAEVAGSLAGLAATGAVATSTALDELAVVAMAFGTGARSIDLEEDLASASALRAVACLAPLPETLNEGRATGTGGRTG
jgi:hypothetical protein